MTATPAKDKKKKAKKNRQMSIAECISVSMAQYFENLGGEQPSDVYQFVMREVEAPLLKSVLDHCEQNQTLAADILGVSRGTLRKKLKQYDLL